MARKIETVVVPTWEGNRDAGKQFLITEMPAASAEKWALRMFVALKGSGAVIPESSQQLGMVGIAFAGMRTFIHAEVNLQVLEPLLDEMMTCVKMIRDPGAVDRMTGAPVATPLASDDDIEEVQTRVWLRSEVLRVHTNFSVSEALSKWISEAATWTSSNT